MQAQVGNVTVGGLQKPASYFPPCHQAFSIIWFISAWLLGYGLVTEVATSKELVRL